MKHLGNIYKILFVSTSISNLIPKPSSSCPCPMNRPPKKALSMVMLRMTLRTVRKWQKMKDRMYLRILCWRMNAPMFLIIVLLQTAPFSCVLPILWQQFIVGNGDDDNNDVTSLITMKMLMIMPMLMMMMLVIVMTTKILSRMMLIIMFMMKFFCNDI